MQRSNDEGLELGLAIVLTIVQQHGGQVRVEREPGRRGTIHLTLPVEPADEPANLALARGEVRVRTSGEQRVRQT
jgi:signal transduction histidine kinase